MGDSVAENPRAGTAESKQAQSGIDVIDGMTLEQNGYMLLPGQDFVRFDLQKLRQARDYVRLVMSTRLSSDHTVSHNAPKDAAFVGMVERKMRQEMKAKLFDDSIRFAEAVREYAVFHRDPLLLQEVDAFLGRLTK